MTPQQLKNSILQRAIEGRLVPQKAEEGTAKELLQKIQTEKAQLIAEKKIKKTKVLPPISDDEIPFDIPDSWEWVRLDSLFYISTGLTPLKSNTAYYDGGTIPWITSSQTSNDTILNAEQYITDLAVKENSLEIYPKNTLLIALYGQGKTRGQVAKLLLSATINQACAALVPFVEYQEFIEYVFYCMKFNYHNMRKQAGGTSQPNLNLTKIKNIVIPIPPLPEQKRIVAKIEKLLPFIDKYDKAYTKLTEFNARFPEDMKKSILQYAIEGKLVEQRKEEGSADALLQQIQAEKKRLIEEKKIKKTKPLPQITENEIPFDIPDSWEWVRLVDIFDIARGGSPRPIKEFLTTDENGINWVKIGDTEIGGKYIKNTKEKIIADGLKKSRLVKHGDLLLTNSMSYGRPYIMQTRGAIHDGWLVLSPYIDEIDKDFFYYLISAPYIKNEFANTVAGAVVKNLNKDKVKEIIVPLPPLAEQHRIVAKIEELLPLCEQLIK